MLPFKVEELFFFFFPHQVWFHLHVLTMLALLIVKYSAAGPVKKVILQCQTEMEVACVQLLCESHFKSNFFRTNNLINENILFGAYKLRKFIPSKPGRSGFLYKQKKWWGKVYSLFLLELSEFENIACVF